MIEASFIGSICAPIQNGLNYIPSDLFWIIVSMLDLRSEQSLASTNSTFFGRFDETFKTRSLVSPTLFPYRYRLHKPLSVKITGYEPQKIFLFLI